MLSQVQTEAAAIAQKVGLKALEPFIQRMIFLEQTVQRLEALLKYHGLSQ